MIDENLVSHVHATVVGPVHKGVPRGRLAPKGKVLRLAVRVKALVNGVLREGMEGGGG